MLGISKLNYQPYYRLCFALIRMLKNELSFFVSFAGHCYSSFAICIRTATTITWFDMSQVQESWWCGACKTLKLIVILKFCWVSLDFDILFQCPWGIVFLMAYIPRYLCWPPFCKIFWMRLQYLIICLWTIKVFLQFDMTPLTQNFSLLVELFHSDCRVSIQRIISNFDAATARLLSHLFIYFKDHLS